MGGDCKVRDQYGYEYNLTSLMKSAGDTPYYQLTDSRGHTYYVNVCGGVGSGTGAEACSTDTGACQVTADGKSFSAGQLQDIKNIKVAFVLRSLKSLKFSCSAL